MKPLLIVLSLFASKMFAQEIPSCAHKDEMKKILKDSYNETIVRSGISEDGLVIVQWFSNPIKHTFTIVFTNYYGKSCIAFTGKGDVSFPVYGDL